MADDLNQLDSQQQPENTAKGQTGVQNVIDKFRGLPRPTQIVIVAGIFVVLYVLMSGRGGDQPTQFNNADATNVATQRSVQQGEAEDVFAGIETERPALIQSWFEQNRREIADLRDEIDRRFEERDQTLAEALNQLGDLQREISQQMADFTAEVRSIEASSKRDREVIGQLADETRRLQATTPSALGGEKAAAPTLRKKTRIGQTPLGGGPSAGPVGEPLLGGIVQRATGRQVDGASTNLGAADELEDHLPFVPPLGFVRGTMLNGVDALVGGTATPALVRLHGKYRTAMNSTVILDGCYMLVEFQGEISTERAIGKPSRMTCVYPDRGAVTYSVSGYVVDSTDGIIGVPGIFYEGDATRIAAAILADFAAGVAQIIEQNQSTFTVDSDGTAQKTLTGDEVRAEIAGGVDSSVGSLRDYLFERANRVLPFVRIDATRDIHLVFLSGVELRAEGSPWSLLFAADN